MARLGLLVVMAACGLAASDEVAAQGADRPDLMTFALGALPVAIDTGGADLRTASEEAIGLIDGNPGGLTITKKPAVEGDRVEIVYALPAPTLFDRFAVPNVLETPSPSQTFFSNVDVSGSAESPDGPFQLLASGQLETHEEVGLVTDLDMAAEVAPVRWVRVVLSGGISVERDKTFLEFSEIIGNGTQETPALSERFTGVWRGRGVNIELSQDGPSVTGCYDKTDALTGTVDGSILRALGESDAGIPSQFILTVGEDGGLRGLRSTNGGLFKVYDGEASDREPVCLPSDPPRLGCGDIIHGIQFDFDSDVIQAGSAPVLRAMFDGLNAEAVDRIEIVGHSSSEGLADYNRDLSERRAQSVVASLVALGLDAARISASGRGEDEPIASNDDEAGRSLNRRVEVRCAG